MLRQVKPKNARSKRALAAREPKHVENPKSALFLRGTTCSQIVQDALADLFALRQPLSKKFTKKNSIRPFEDPSSLEFFAQKNDAALLCFGSSSKKRPHTITLTRTFGHNVLDMLELYLDQESLRTLKQFKGRKPNIGQRPMILFAGTAFESPVADEYTLAKSMFTDLFRCEGGSSADSGQLDVEALQHIVSITCSDPPSPDQKPVLRLRCYAIVTKRSGQKLPRIELEEMGPRMDFRVGRSRQADEAMLKEALKKGKTTEAREKKNVSMDVMGDKMGRIHLGRQDLSEMSLRRYKGLKRGRGGDGDVGAAEEDDIETPKKRKK